MWFSRWSRRWAQLSAAVLLIGYGSSVAIAESFADIKQFMQGLAQSDNPGTTRNELQESKDKIKDRISNISNGNGGVRISVTSNQKYVNPALTQYAIDQANAKGLKTYLSPALANAQMSQDTFDKWKNKCNFISVYNESGTNNFPSGWSKGSAKCCGPDVKDLKKTVDAGWDPDTKPQQPGKQPGPSANNPYSRYDIITSHNLDDDNGIQGPDAWKKLKEIARGKQVWDSECLGSERINSARDGGVNSIVYYARD